MTVESESAIAPSAGHRVTQGDQLSTSRSCSDGENCGHVTRRLYNCIAVHPGQALVTILLERQRYPREHHTGALVIDDLYC